MATTKDLTIRLVEESFGATAEITLQVASDIVLSALATNVGTTSYAWDVIPCEPSLLVGLSLEETVAMLNCALKRQFNDRQFHPYWTVPGSDPDDDDDFNDWMYRQLAKESLDATLAYRTIEDMETLQDELEEEMYWHLSGE